MMIIMGTNKINQISDASIANIAKMFGINKAQVEDLFLRLKSDSMPIIEEHISHGKY